MGREIVYCWKCATRLQTDDFEKSKAYRVGDKVSCADCVFELVADLPAEEQEAILSPQNQKKKPSSTKIKTAANAGSGTQVRRGGTRPIPKARTGTTGRIPTVSPTTGTRSISKKITRPIPKVAPPSEDELEGGSNGAPGAAAKKKKIILLSSIGGGLLVLLLIVLVLALGSDKPKGPPLEDPAENAGSTKKSAAAASAKTESPKEQPAKTAFLAAQSAKTSSPTDLAIQWKAWKEAQEAGKGTSYEGKAEPELAALKGRMDKEIAALDAESKPLREQEKFKKLLGLWEAVQSRYDIPDWKEIAATRLKQYTGIMDDEYAKLKRDAKKAVTDGDEAAKAAMVARVAGWEFPEKTAEIDSLRPGTGAETAADPTPDARIPSAQPLTAEMKAFLPLWSQAVLPAFSRDYSAAADAIQKAGRDQGSDEVKKAAEADAADLRELPRLIEEGRKNAAGLKKLQSVTLEYQAAPSEWKKVSGKVVKVEAQRIELTTDLKDKPRMFVELADLAASSLAEYYLLNRREANDEKLAGILCLLEGDPEGAKKHAGRNAGRIAERFWQIAKEIREKSPKPSSREFEARNLFHMAELEWRELRTRGNAMDKYRLLMGDYSSTEYVRKTQTTMTSRSGEGKEYVFYPGKVETLNAGILKHPGAMDTFKATNKYAPKAELALVTMKEIDERASIENYVQIEFYALPNTTYRCWLYIGGCCEETMSFYYQMSEGKAKSGSKEVSIEPGSRAADLFKPPLVSLPKEHAKHKPKDPKASNPKEPTRWEWVELKLPKPYAAPGAKEIRIFTEQPGFGIGYAIVTSKPTAIDPKIKADLDKELVAAPKPIEIKGTAQPTEWWVAGPFPESLDADNGPDGGVIDLKKELKGKNGNVSWKSGNAVTSGAHAVFDWKKNGMLSAKDNVSVYALIHVKPLAAMAAQLSIGHADGAKVWLNGTEVHKNDRSGALKNDEFKVKIQLNDGWNRLLFKVRTGSTSFGLSMRILDSAGKPIEGLEYNATGDQLEGK
jgi:hypothetical protein